ncbi:MAG: type II secretion system GspH family protein [Candidatus Gastranaerophilales bacterium]|nr:type II secretion system GspH family protein [Candidatus Gastranaerophilales bacterium]
MKKLCFTLVELLITLVIIGVISVITVPSLINYTNGLEYKAAFKKAVSSVNQALKLNYTSEGTAAYDFEDSTDLVNNLFKKEMNVIEDDDTEFPGTEDSACDGPTWMTTDGVIYCIKNFNPQDAEGNNSEVCNNQNTKPCGDPPNIYIDVNGEKTPNTVTVNSNSPKDIYYAVLYAQNVIPYGDAAQQVMYDDKKVTDSVSGS